MTHLQPNTITCKSCNNQFNGTFCNQCGEKVHDEHNKKISHLFEEVFHFITHFEGTFFTTLKTILTKPGKLSADYCNGIQKKYFKPIPFFLILVILYLFFPIFDGLNVNMTFHKSDKYYGKFARQKVEAKLVETKITEAELQEKFKIKSEKISKFLLISIIPFTAFIFYTLSFFKRKYFFDSIVFATEVNAFYLLWGFLILPLLIVLVIFLFSLFSSHKLLITDEIITFLIKIPTILFVAKAINRFYGFNWWQRAIFIVVFYFTHTIIVYSIYKFLLFVTIMSQIH